MGCCQGHSSGEGYMRGVIESLNFGEITYEVLKADLIEKSNYDKIEIRVLKSKIFDSHVTSVEHKFIFDLIIRKVDAKTSIYWVLFYLFPFLKKSESDSKNMYEIMFQLNKNTDLNIDDVSKFIKMYYEYVLISITEEINFFLRKASNDKVERRETNLDDLESILNTSFNIRNLESEVNFLIRLIECESENEGLDKIKERFINQSDKVMVYFHNECVNYFIRKYGEV